MSKNITGNQKMATISAKCTEKKLMDDLIEVYQSSTKSAVENILNMCIAVKEVDEKYKGQGLQTDSIINAIVSSNKAVVEKLDKLTSMMASGQIAVYIDGQRANQLLATSNSKFGSFGQATTN